MSTIEERQAPCFIVVIRHQHDGKPEEIVDTRGPHPRWKAEKIDGGMNINLNHEHFYTMIFTEGELKAWKEKHAPGGATAP